MFIISSLCNDMRIWNNITNESLNLASRGVLVLLVSVQILLCLDFFCHSITMEVWKPARWKNSQISPKRAHACSDVLWMSPSSTGSFLQQDQISYLFHQWCKYIISQRIHFIWMKIYSFPWITSPVPSSSNDMIIWNNITNESLNLASSSCVWWISKGSFLLEY